MELADVHGRLGSRADADEQDETARSHEPVKRQVDVRSSALLVIPAELVRARPDCRDGVRRVK